MNSLHTYLNVFCIQGASFESFFNSSSKLALATWYQAPGTSATVSSFGFELVSGCIRCKTNVAMCAASWCCDEGKAGVTGTLEWAVLVYSDSTKTPSKKACHLDNGVAACNAGNIETKGDSVVSVMTDGGFWPDTQVFEETTQCPQNFRRLTNQECHPNFFKHKPFLFEHTKSYGNRPPGCSAFFNDEYMSSLFWNNNPNGQLKKQYRLLCIPGNRTVASLSKIPIFVQFLVVRWVMWFCFLLPAITRHPDTEIVP